MSLTSAQRTTLKNAINADPTLSTFPNTADGCFEIANILNAVASPNYWVWNTGAPVSDILDQVAWANFTPNDSPDNTVTYQNRCMLVQTKQMNLQLMLQGRDRIDASKGTIRTGLNDATTSLPTGAGGALRQGGWNGIVTVLRRKANGVEKVLAVVATGTGNDGVTRGSTTNPDNLGYEGNVTYQDVLDARAS